LARDDREIFPLAWPGQARPVHAYWPLPLSYVAKRPMPKWQNQNGTTQNAKVQIVKVHAARRQNAQFQNSIYLKINFHRAESILRPRACMRAHNRLC